MILLEAVLVLFWTASVSLAEEIDPPKPWPLAHWVLLTNGSLLVGRVESIDAESLRIDLRLEKKMIVSVPRSMLTALVVIPPVDPVLAKKLLDEPGAVLNEPGAVPPNDRETIRFVDGATISGRLRSFSKGVFRFDFPLGGLDGLSLESQTITWRRIRTIFFHPGKKNALKYTVIFLRNGSKIVCDSVENTSNDSVLVKCIEFPVMELPLSSVIFPSTQSFGKEPTENR